MNEAVLQGRQDYSFQIRDNFLPIQLEWEDEVNDPAICGEMPVLRKNYKDVEFDFAVYASELDLVGLVERSMKWENAYTNM